MLAASIFAVFRWATAQFSLSATENWICLGDGVSFGRVSGVLVSDSISVPILVFFDTRLAFPEI